eukprot:TRINITY_DN18637_c0_g1_i1.p1 TRINITY_DN18637_c0_g1~~TRINITY_DN18637_c0_g1_i1.p1  ORF type:complete len:119 (+),score=7.81 TRINITY_DN18637_c0_g1_i1:130-486(+)
MTCLKSSLLWKTNSFLSFFTHKENVLAPNNRTVSCVEIKIIFISIREYSCCTNARRHFSLNTLVAQMHTVRLLSFPPYLNSSCDSLLRFKPLEVKMSSSFGTRLNPSAITLEHYIDHL